MRRPPGDEPDGDGHPPEDDPEEEPEPDDDEEPEEEEEEEEDDEPDVRTVARGSTSAADAFRACMADGKEHTADDLVSYAQQRGARCEKTNAWAFMSAQIREGTYVSAGRGIYRLAGKKR